MLMCEYNEYEFHSTRPAAGNHLHTYIHTNNGYECTLFNENRWGNFVHFRLFVLSVTVECLGLLFLFISSFCPGWFPFRIALFFWLWAEGMWRWFIGSELNQVHRNAALAAGWKCNQATALEKTFRRQVGNLSANCCRPIIFIKLAAMNSVSLFGSQSIVSTQSLTEL